MLAARPQDWRVKLFSAARALADPQGGGRDEAIRQLTEAESLAPSDPQLWEQLTLQYQQLGLPERADQARAKFCQIMPDKWAQSSLESRLLAARGEIVPAIKAAQQSLADAPAAKQEAIQRSLVDLHRATGNLDDARKVLTQIHERHPEDIETLQNLAQVNLELGDLAGVEAVEAKFKDIEGEDGVRWRYFRASRLLADPARSAEAPTEPSKLQQEIESRLPGWAFGHLLKGDIHVRSRQFDRAAAAYERAIELGDRRLTNYERLLASLYESGQYEKADAVAQQLQNFIANSQNLANLSTAIAARADRLPEAIARAQQLVAEQPKQANAHIWLAQLLATSGRDAEAEGQLREAVKIDRTQLPPWLALFSFVATRNPELAAKSLQQIDKVSSGLPPVQRAMLLGSCYQRLGRLDEAQKYYQQAAELDPNNASHHVRLAAMRLNSDPKLAEAELRRALEIDPKSVPARQMLAVLLVSRGGQQEWQEVQQLIGADQPDASNQPGDLRLRVILLMQRGGTENLKKARESLEKLVSRSESRAPGDHLLLASIYEAEGNLEAAQQQYETLATQSSPEPRSLYLYADYWLRNRDLDKAAQWLDKLDQATASSAIAARLEYLEARARWLSASGKADQIGPLVQTYATQQEQSLKPDQKTEHALLYNGVGQILLTARDYAAAEPWFRKLTEVVPERVDLLTRVLALQNRHQEAIDMILGQHPSGAMPPPEAMIALTDILSAGKPDPQVWERTEPIWQQAAAAPADNVLIPMLAAAARAIQGRDDEAIAILQRVQEQKPDQPIVLNNLATMLGQKAGSQEQALKYIDRAIEIVGPQPAFLDTKSLILVELGKPQEAVDLLRHLVAIPRPDPRVLFRLAIAQLRAGSPTEAQAMFARAVSLGLESQVLTVRDQELLKELQ